MFEGNERQLKKGRQLFLRKKVHRGNLAGGFSDLEMTWLFYCAGAATDDRATHEREPVEMRIAD